MSRHALIPFHSMPAFTLLAGFALSAAAATDARVSESYGKLPLQFEANRGQTHKDVRFLSRGPGYSLYLTGAEAVLVLTNTNADAKRSTQALSKAKAQPKSVALRVSLLGAARKPQATGLDELPGKPNYFIGKDRSQWRTNVPTYAKVHYQNVYPGIDLVYYGNQRQLEYDFVVAPGADPKKIVLGFKGTDKLEIDAEGDLVLHASGGDVRQHKPIIYQEIDRVRQEIDGRYGIKSGKRVGLQLALGIGFGFVTKLDATGSTLVYSTYLGAGAQGAGIAVDAEGNAYMTGQTGSAMFPTTPGAFQPVFGGGPVDAFVMKLNADGSALVYSTYLGGSNVEVGGGIAVDTGGNAYVTGGTDSTNFPTTPEAFQTVPGSGFVTKLDPTGSSLVYSTYLNASSGAIAVDAQGNAYVTGTASTDFQTTPGAFQPVLAGSFDAFVAKINPPGSGLAYSTYLGGTNEDHGNGIAVNAAGNAYVTGYTSSNNFPTTPDAAQPAL